MIVAVEGCDGAGKATQAALLAARYDCAQVRSFPDYSTETGKLILQFLKGERVVTPEKMYWSEELERENSIVLQALMTANRYEIGNSLDYWARSSYLTVLDRYWLSGYAYGTADGLDPTWLTALHTLLPEPAAWILLDVPTETSFARRPDRRDAYEADPGRLERARSAYLATFSSGRERERPFFIIDGTRSVDEVAEEVRVVVERAVPQVNAWRK